MKKTSLNDLEYLDISPAINAMQVPGTPSLNYLLGVGKTEQANSTEIEWREYDISNDDSSEKLEGGDYPSAESGRNWFNNYTEIFRKSTSVSGILDAINMSGVGNELANQVALRGMEVKIDLNRKLITGVRADESDSKGHRVSGILNLINSASKAEAATAGAVTRKDIGGLFRLMYEKGYMGEKLCLTSPDTQRLVTDELDGKSTRVVQFDERVTFGLQIGNITSNYGTGIALLGPSLPKEAVTATDTNYMKLRPLCEWKAEELAKTTDSRRIGLIDEYSLEYNASNSGTVLNLKFK